jgi:hypothetical protein
MNIRCYKFINSRISKNIIFIEKNDIIDINYKVILHWKNDNNIESYTNRITVSMDYFTNELMNISPSICEAYNISKKLSIIDETKTKVLHYYITRDFYDKTEFKIEPIKSNFKNLKNNLDNDDKSKDFISSFEYMYSHRREGQPKLEDIDDIKELIPL